MPVPSILLIHGTAGGAWMWDTWRAHLKQLGWRPVVIDLRGHGRSVPTDLSTVTLEDYVADIASVTAQIEAAEGVQPVLGGWSLGGLLAMMYAAREKTPPALLLMAPSPPLEIAGKADIDAVRKAAGDVLGPEVLGVYPDDLERSRQTLFDLGDEDIRSVLEHMRGGEESGIAYRQRLRGVSVPSEAIKCPSLVLYGDRESDVMQEELARLGSYLHGESHVVAHTGHWGIFAHEESVAEAAREADEWLRRTLPEVP